MYDQNANARAFRWHYSRARSSANPRKILARRRLGESNTVPAKGTAAYRAAPGTDQSASAKRKREPTFRIVWSWTPLDGAPTPLALFQRGAEKCVGNILSPECFHSTIALFVTCQVTPR